ncbi:MAG: hypothetical protein KGL39_06595 [Patescibacteria group bacterium]|nr:hypothetical protein [Patescibacteria group bacterium]
MSLFKYYEVIQKMPARALAKHLRDALNMPECTAEFAKEKGQKEMLELVWRTYKARGIPLVGAPEWPWSVAAGHITPEQAPAPQAGSGTARDASASLAKTRLAAALPLGDAHCKAAREMVDPETNQPLIDGMGTTGPGYVHPYYFKHPRLPQGRQYRVAVIFNPQENGQHNTHLGLNGEMILASRETIVAIPRQFLQVAQDAVFKKHQPKVDTNGVPLPMAWGEEMTWQRLRTESFQIIGDVVTDDKGNIIEWLTRFDGQEIPKPTPYRPEEARA